MSGGCTLSKVEVPGIVVDRIVDRPQVSRSFLMAVPHNVSMPQLCVIYVRYANRKRIRAPGQRLDDDRLLC